MKRKYGFEFIVNGYIEIEVECPDEATKILENMQDDILKHANSYVFSYELTNSNPLKKK